MRSRSDARGAKKEARAFYQREEKLRKQKAKRHEKTENTKAQVDSVGQDQKSELQN